AWQTALAADGRPDTVRLGDLHPPPFSNVSQLDMVRSVGERHFWQAQNAMPRGWQWWTNFTAVSFLPRSDGKPATLRHRIYGFNQQGTGPEMQAYIVADIPLDVTEKPPEKPIK